MNNTNDCQVSITMKEKDFKGMMKSLPLNDETQPLRSQILTVLNIATGVYLNEGICTFYWRRLNWDEDVEAIKFISNYVTSRESYNLITIRENHINGQYIVNQKINNAENSPEFSAMARLSLDIKCYGKRYDEFKLLSDGTITIYK